MKKYKYILRFKNGDILDSIEEYGDNIFSGLFSSYEDAEEAALYAISCYRQGAETLNMCNPGEYDYDEKEKIAMLKMN